MTIRYLPKHFQSLINTRISWRLQSACLFVSLSIWSAFASAGLDPFATNNTLYPTTGKLSGDWPYGFRVSNYDYPVQPVAPVFNPYTNSNFPKAPLNGVSAETYVQYLKEFITNDMSGLVNDPLNWSPLKAGWYDMPWGAEGERLPNGKIDGESGREALIGSYTGQILPKNTFKPPHQVPESFQNFAVIYYNDVAGYHLGQVWKDPFNPDLSNTQFPEGSIVVKVEAATLTPDQWSPLTGSSVSYAYRPTVKKLLSDPPDKTPEIIPLYFSQMAIKIKDSIASPETGWVFIAFAYDTNAPGPGTTVWDKTVPVGAMWGNDPEDASYTTGRNPKNAPLQETWINQKAPSFTQDTLGWGGRLAGPMDVARRHNVVTVSGKTYQGDDEFAATSCMSCHGAAQFPFVANLYSSPNLIFPEDGTQFLLYDPGTEQWEKWFQNRPGTEAMSGNGRDGITPIDYDLLMTFALGRANVEAGDNTYLQNRNAGH